MIIQVTIVTVTLLGFVCAAKYGGGYPAVVGEAAEDGYGEGAHGRYGGGQNYPPKPHHFNYFVDDKQGNSHYRNERIDQSGAVKGTYGYTDAQGLYRIVEYVADAGGFRANISTNEPGTDDKENPADINILVMKSSADIQHRNEQIDQSGAVRGTYGHTDAQGLYRIVEYVADAEGFRHNTRTNEPGTGDKENPADVNILLKKLPAVFKNPYSKNVGAGGGGSVGLPVDTYTGGVKNAKCETGENFNRKECLLSLSNG